MSLITNEDLKYLFNKNGKIELGKPGKGIYIREVTNPSKAYMICLGEGTLEEKNKIIKKMEWMQK